MLHRAYSTIDVKGIDEERRVITGMATTPTPDRVGDIVEPLGVSFQNPLPFLLYHDGKLPVGEVRFDPPTKAGIKFTATLPKVIEPGTVKDRVDEAWHSAKYKLLRGVSIGFRSIEEAFNKGTQGYRYIRSEIVELSFVAIPMNVEATVHTVKSYDDLAQRAIGTAAPVSSQKPPAAVGVRRTKDASMQPISDRITSALADLKTKSTRLEALEEQEGADGSLESAEIIERDMLTGEVKALSSRVERLKALEAAELAQAQHIVVKAPSGDVRQVEHQLPRVEFKEKKFEPGIELARYIIARGVALMTGSSALEVAKARYGDSPRVALMAKEAVAGASTYDSTNASSLVYAQNLVGEFLEYLRPMTILGRIQGMTRIPFNSRIAGQTSGGSAGWVGEGRAKPVTSFGFNDTLHLWAKLAAISVLTEELARFGNPSAEGRVRTGLTGALQARMDIDFINPAKAAELHVSPASILNGITPLVSHGNDLDAVDADVQAMFNVFLNANITPTTGVWIMPNSVALALSLMRNSMGNRAFPDINMNGGTFYGLPVVASQYAVFGTPTRKLVALVNAEDIYLSDDGGFSVDVSREATIEMDDAPTQSVGPLGSPAGATGGSSAFVSMFQTNSLAIRAERYINWSRRRDAGVTYTDDVNWAPGGASV